MKCKIPYQVQTILAAAIILAIFGDTNLFPLWCVYTSYAIFFAVPAFWTGYAFHHKDYETTTNYLLVSLVIAIIFLVKLFYFIR